MKYFLLILFILSCVVTKSQPSTFKLYRNGKVVGTAEVDISNKVVTKVRYNYHRAKKVKKAVPPVEKIQYKIVEVLTKPTAVDTLAILQQYYVKNVFNDVLVLDKGQGTINITDTVSHNRLTARTWSANIKPRVIREIVPVQPTFTREYFLGPEITTGYDGLSSWYGLNLLIRSAPNSIVKLGTGINMRDSFSGPKAYLVGGYYFRIK